MLCWLLLCSDLGIRSGTAARLTPASYSKGQLRYGTKYGSEQCVGVTAALRPLLEACDKPRIPFVAQLPRGHALVRGGKMRRVTVSDKLSVITLRELWVTLCRRAGIERNIRPHDLRRTTARSLYMATRDLRDVRNMLGHQRLSSTVWYLETELSAVSTELLELAKLNPITERPQ